MNPFQDWKSNSLLWLPEMGIGYYPVTACPYDESYWLKYVGYSKTPMGKAITAARVKLVSGVIGEGQCLVDIGIGCGDFVGAMGCYGYDINPIAVEWLRENAALLDPYSTKVECATFWDSLEHIRDIDKILAMVTDKVFVTIPIFNGPEHILISKHYRKDEHFWYFTHKGFIGWMAAQGFTLITHNDMENDLGREGTRTYVFQR